jgi:superfamily II RNA helicase
MIQEDIDNKLTNYQLDINKVQTDIDRSVISLKHIKTPANVINDYIDLKSKLLASVNKKRKEFERAIGKLEDTYDIKNIVKDMNSYTNHNNKVLLMNKLTNEKTQLEQNLDTNIQIILKVLVNDCFISYNKPKFNIMLKGVVATHIREVHCLVFASLIVDKQFNTLCVKELIGVLSCFTNVKVSDEFKAAGPISKNKKVVEIIDTLNLMYKTYNDLEVCHLINTGTDYSIHFDLIDYLIQWTECETEQECKFVLQQIREEKGIFLGEFIKAILKINNIVTEMSSAYELLGDMEMLQKCKDVPQLLLKFVATNQSLYV